MTKASRALWRRRRNWRRRRVSYWRARGNTRQLRKWLKLLADADARLAPRSASIRGIDVSSHNGKIDWQLVKKSGVDFAFCKTSEGEDWADPSWTRKRVTEMRLAKVKVGVYHFLRPKAGRSGAVEARYFLERARFAGWGRRGDLRPVIDFEATAVDEVASIRYLREAVREVKRQTGVSPIVYTGGFFWKEATGNATLNYGCPLWIAAYVKGSPDEFLPPPWRLEGWTIWQHSDKGRVAGVSGDVDVNVAVSLPVI